MWSDVQVRHNASVIIRDDVVTRHDVMLHKQLMTTRWQVAPRAYFTVECYLEMYPWHRAPRKRVVGNRNVPVVLHNVTPSRHISCHLLHLHVVVRIVAVITIIVAFRHTAACLTRESRLWPRLISRLDRCGRFRLSRGGPSRNWTSEISYDRSRQTCCCTRRSRRGRRGSRGNRRGRRRRVGT